MQAPGNACRLIAMRLALLGALCFAAALSPGCSADTSPSRAASPHGSVEVVLPGTGPDASIAHDGASTMDAALPASVVITAPGTGTSFTRNTIEAAEWVARVAFQVSSTGVTRVELVAAGTSLGDVDATGALSYSFHGDGVIMVDAIGRNAAGTELARSSISITIAPPADTGCHAMLDALGLDWAVAAPEHGIADPVRVQPHIHGVTYRYETSTTAAAMLMDCQLGPRLYQLSELVRTYDVVEIEHIGIYNYRCIGGGNPDTDGCTPSMHARAQAIDLHAFITSTGTRYDVTRDFVITRTHDTCPIASSSEPDRILKAIACALVADRTFQIVLTPNYNADHRDHFHCDLTAGSMYLGAGAWGVDPVIEGLGD
jgi:hypothetical protein